MKDLLILLATKYLWLFETYRFRIVDSQCNTSFGGQGFIELENGVLRLRFIKDRGEPYVEVVPLLLPDWPEDSAITVDLLYQEIVGEIRDVTVVCNETTEFLRENFAAVSELFQGGSGESLHKRFSTLKSARAKRLFG